MLEYLLIIYSRKDINNKPRLNLKTVLAIWYEANSDDELWSIRVCNNACKKYGISSKRLGILFQIAKLLEKAGLLKFEDVRQKKLPINKR